MSDDCEFFAIWPLARWASRASSESCRRACEVLALYPGDIPFAALYITGTDDGQAHRIAANRNLDRSNSCPPWCLLHATLTTQWPLDALFSDEIVQDLPDLHALDIDIPAPVAGQIRSSVHCCFR